MAWTWTNQDHLTPPPDLVFISMCYGLELQLNMSEIVVYSCAECDPCHLMGLSACPYPTLFSLLLIVFSLIFQCCVLSPAFGGRGPVMQLSWRSLNKRWRRCRTGRRGVREWQSGQESHMCASRQKKLVCKTSFRGGENLQALRAGRGEDFHKGCDEFWDWVLFFFQMHKWNLIYHVYCFSLRPVLGSLELTF